MITISDNQALQILAYLSNSSPCDVSSKEEKVLIEAADSLMYDIAEKLNIDWDGASVNPITLEVENL